MVVPRFCSHLIAESDGLPLGPDVWNDTRIILPPDSAARSYRNLFTGEVLCFDREEGPLSLALQDILSVFPVALLVEIIPSCNQ